MADWRYEEHLRSPVGLNELPDDGFDGVAGGAACGDLIKVKVQISEGNVAGVGFAAEGCGALTVCGSVISDLAADATVLDAARISVAVVCEELGGLHPGKLHAAELAVDAFHRALGSAACEMENAPLGSGAALVAMSGGVDSAVVAALAGEGAVGVTLELWRDIENDAESSCCSHSAVRRARDLAHGMGMAHLTVDLREQFKAGVVDPWMEGQRSGVTPNPCVRCNGDVRLDALLDLADRIGCGQLHTGHYARKSPNGLLRLAEDPLKDQAYMLCGLDLDSVARIEFPLGELTKPRVREIASERGLSVAKQPDSQDLCFLAGTGAAQFLARHAQLAEKPGRVLELDTGEEIGEHRGAHLYTVGQRRGLGVAAGSPRYVLGTNVHDNTVVVGTKTQLLTSEVQLEDLVMHRPASEVDGVKLRYKQKPRTAALDGEVITLAEPLVRPAPGQTAMFLAGDEVVGHATVASSIGSSSHANPTNAVVA